MGIWELPQHLLAFRGKPRSAECKLTCSQQPGKGKNMGVPHCFRCACAAHWLTAGPRQHSDYWFRVTRKSWPNFTLDGLSPTHALLLYWHEFKRGNALLTEPAVSGSSADRVGNSWRRQPVTIHVACCSFFFTMLSDWWTPYRKSSMYVEVIGVRPDFNGLLHKPWRRGQRQSPKRRTPSPHWLGCTPGKISLYTVSVKAWNHVQGWYVSGRRTATKERGDMLKGETLPLKFGLICWTAMYSDWSKADTFNDDTLWLKLRICWRVTYFD
jgi:hypothetical protein